MNRRETHSSGLTENFEELENTPVITMSLILEIIHSFRIKYVYHSIISHNKGNCRLFFVCLFLNEQP